MSKVPSSRLSRKALDALDTDILSDESASLIADTRPAQMERMMTVTEHELEAVREVFTGTKVIEDPSFIRSVLDTTRTVTNAWERAGRSFLEIGRALLALDRLLHTREERARLKAGFEKLFPFSDPIASQFRRVAEMVDAGRVPERLLPGSYSAAYQIALLEPDELQEAQRRGLISPRTSRSAVIAFRRERSRTSKDEVDLRALQAERNQLFERRRKMLDELVNMQKRLREIGQLLDE